MNYFLKKLTLLGVIAVQSVFFAHAAVLSFDSPKSVSSNRSPFVVTVFLETENDSVSGISGDLSFSSELFDVKTISTQNGVIPLWVQSPHVSKDTQFDRKTHITFEGIIPGGFNGMRTPYASGIYPGIVFTVTLIPKNKGDGDISLQDIEIRAYDEKATLLSTKSSTRPVSIASLSGQVYSGDNELTFVSSDSVRMEVSANELIHARNPYVYVYDENPSRAINYIQIAESHEYKPENVSLSSWRTATNPYVLLDASRSKYIHAKIVYTDNTFTYATTEPVENLQSFSQLSRILVYIVIAIFLLYHYGKNFLHLFSKK